ncbi:MAG: asparagine synthase-related protein [Candidatus Woesearchaeota archaeon]
MCGILGFFLNEKVSKDNLDNFNNFRTSYQKSLLNQILGISHRGNDGFGFVVNEKHFITTNFDEYKKSLFENLNLNLQDTSILQMKVLIHFLHSIESFRIQPLVDKELNSSLIFNGEIYNYKELAKYFNLKFEDLEETNERFNDADVLFELLNSFSLNRLIYELQNLLHHLDGDFACVYVRDTKVICFRDILGVKPLWFEYNSENSLFLVTSQRSVQKLGKENYQLKLQEILPTEIVEYSNSNNSLIIHKKIEQLKLDENKLKKLELISKEEQEQKVYELLKQAVKKRIPSDSKKKIGLLFSGGVDSTVLALILKDLGVKFTCYTAHLHSDSLDRAEDYVYSLKIAQEYDFDLKVKTIELDELEELIKTSISIIDDRDYIKVSVALPFVASCEFAQKDEVEIMFSGLGSEEIFAGYRRHRQAEDINLECLKGLNILHIRDLYRDDVITMNFTQELRLPFLDKDLISYALHIPARFKIDIDKVTQISHQVHMKPYLNSQVRSKIILRDIAMKYLNLKEEFANRHKKAAQYGSKFDKGILRLAKNKGLMKQEYLNNL